MLVYTKLRVHVSVLNTNFRRFKMLALRTMAGDALKDDVIFFLRILVTFCMCVGLYYGNQHCVEQPQLNIYVEFCII